jgi:hypothetical protein
MSSQIQQLPFSADVADATWDALLLAVVEAG